jgi:hypothetical protein
MADNHGKVALPLKDSGVALNAHSHPRLACDGLNDKGVDSHLAKSKGRAAFVKRATSETKKISISGICATHKVFVAIKPTGLVKIEGSNLLFV